MHQTYHPAILYFGTPVVLVSTQNIDGSFNLAPISSIFWLGWRCMIGIGTGSKTNENLTRTKECVLNLPTINETSAVDRLALTTGAFPVPPGKLRKGYRYEPNKFEIAGLTLVKSETVAAPSVMECPVQLEATVKSIHFLGEDDENLKGRIATFELKIERVSLEESIMSEDKPDHVDPDKWRPLIMSFQHFYGLGKTIHHSTLATIPEKLYQ